MNRLTLATLISLPCATLVAWWLGGRLGTGVLLGFVMGAFMAGVGIAWQAHVARTKPEQAFNAFAVSFLAKIAVVLFGALAFRFVEPAARWVDYKSFLIAFAAAATVLLVASVPDTARVLRGQRAL